MRRGVRVRHQETDIWAEESSFLPAQIWKHLVYHSYLRMAPLPQRAERRAGSGWRYGVQPLAWQAHMAGLPWLMAPTSDSGGKTRSRSCLPVMSQSSRVPQRCDTHREQCRTGPCNVWRLRLCATASGIPLDMTWPGRRSSWRYSSFCPFVSFFLLKGSPQVAEPADTAGYSGAAAGHWIVRSNHSGPVHEISTGGRRGKAGEQHFTGRQTGWTRWQPARSQGPAARRQPLGGADAIISKAALRCSASFWYSTQYGGFPMGSGVTLALAHRRVEPHLASLRVMEESGTHSG